MKKKKEIIEVHAPNRKKARETMSANRQKYNEKKFKQERQQHEESEKLLHDEYDMAFSSNEPIKELFTGKNIKLKTEVTDEQRSAISVLYSAYMWCVSKGIQFTMLRDVLDEFVIFGVSLDRKSRGEFVNAHQSKMMDEIMKKLNEGKSNDIDNMKV